MQTPTTHASRAVRHGIVKTETATTLTTLFRADTTTHTTELSDYEQFQFAPRTTALTTDPQTSVIFEQLFRDIHTHRVTLQALSDQFIQAGSHIYQLWDRGQFTQRQTTPRDITQTTDYRITNTTERAFLNAIATASAEEQRVITTAYSLFSDCHKYAIPDASTDTQTDRLDTFTTPDYTTTCGNYLPKPTQIADEHLVLTTGETVDIEARPRTYAVLWTEYTITTPTGQKTPTLRLPLLATTGGGTIAYDQNAQFGIQTKQSNLSPAAQTALTHLIYGSTEVLTHVTDPVDQLLSNVNAHSLQQTETAALIRRCIQQK